MKKLVYFRMLYEYEKQHDVLGKIKEYIHRDNSEIIKDMCVGDLHLPSPFLLDELEWSLNTHDHNVKEIIYQLKVKSREFYTSLVDFNPEQYDIHFNGTSVSLGQQMISSLEKLQLYHSVVKNPLLSIIKTFLSSPPLFSSVYPNLFKLILLASWYLCVALEADNSALAMLFPSVVGTIILMSALGLERRINMFKSSDITGHNLLAMRYMEFVIRLQNAV